MVFNRLGHSAGLVVSKCAYVLVFKCFYKSGKNIFWLLPFGNQVTRSEYCLCSQQFGSSSHLHHVVWLSPQCPLGLFISLCLIKEKSPKALPTEKAQIQFKVLVRHSGWDLNYRRTSKFAEKLFVIVVVIITGLVVKHQPHTHSEMIKITDQHRACEVQPTILRGINPVQME